MVRRCALLVSLGTQVLGMYSLASATAGRDGHTQHLRPLGVPPDNRGERDALAPSGGRVPHQEFLAECRSWRQSRAFGIVFLSRTQRLLRANKYRLFRG